MAVDDYENKVMFDDVNKVFWFWKLLIIHRNQESLFLNPVYMHLKSIFQT